VIFDVAPTELLVLGVVALLVIPPKDLPKAMRVAGQWMGRARGMARQFRSGFDDLIRESEFQEMEKKWKAENERIMREFPGNGDPPALMAPLPQDDPAELAGSEAPAVMTEMPKVEPSVMPEPKPRPRVKAEVKKKPAARKPAAKRTKP
jgi:sec-independent protein translocase protein TatB